MLPCAIRIYFYEKYFQAEKRGLVMVNFFSYFLTCSNHSTLNDVVSKYLLVFYQVKFSDQSFWYQYELKCLKGQCRRKQFSKFVQKDSETRCGVEYLFL